MRFTVVIPAYNSSKYIRAAIESVQSATLYENYEILIVDDCSDDLAELKMVVQDYPEARLIEKPLKTNAADSRNIGFTQSQSQYVFFLDSDDQLIANSVDRRISFHTEMKAGIVFGNYISVVSSRCRPSDLATYSGENMAEYLFSGAGDFRSSSISIYKKIYKNTLFDPMSNKHQDWIYAIRCAKNHEVIMFDETPSVLLHEDRELRMSAAMNVAASRYFVDNYLEKQHQINRFSKAHWIRMIISKDSQACRYFFSIYCPDNLLQCIQYRIYMGFASRPTIFFFSPLIRLLLRYKRIFSFGGR